MTEDEPVVQIKCTLVRISNDICVVPVDCGRSIVQDDAHREVRVSGILASVCDSKGGVRGAFPDIITH
jgi:hypothetical protein